jgi:hypothetical protein
MSFSCLGFMMLLQDHCLLLHLLLLPWASVTWVLL